MASFVYDAAIDAAWQGDLALDTADVKMLLLTDDYTASQTADVYVSSITTAARIETTAVLTSKVFTLGMFDAADPALSALTGNTVDAIALFVDTGSDATSRLLSYHTVTPSFVPTGTDVVISIPTTGIWGKS